MKEIKSHMLLCMRFGCIRPRSALDMNLFGSIQMQLPTKSSTYLERCLVFRTTYTYLEHIREQSLGIYYLIDTTFFLIKILFFKNNKHKIISIILRKFAHHISSVFFERLYVWKHQWNTITLIFGHFIIFLNLCL